jgi:hypothetical protein
MELTMSSTPSFSSGVATTVSLSSARTARACGGGGALRDGWGLVGTTPDRFGFFGQFLDMCPCCLQKKHHPSAISHCLSLSLRGFRVFMASTSITFRSREEELPPCPRCPKHLCHWALVPRFPWLLFWGQKDRIAFLARYFRSLSRTACCHWFMVLGQTSQFMIALRVPGRSPEQNTLIVPSLVNSHPAFVARELNVVM